MVELEATGGSIWCSRCGRAAPRAEADRADWGSYFMNGRLVMLACPQCLSVTERDEISARRGSALSEVAAGRRADPSALRRIAEEAARRGWRSPPEAWLAALDPVGLHVGVLTGQAGEDWVLSLWAGQGHDGARRGAFVQLAVARWMELSEVFVPYSVQRWAAAQAAQLDADASAARPGD